MFDLEIISDSARECGFVVVEKSQESIAVELAQGHVLVFENRFDQADEAIYFKDAGSRHSRSRSTWSSAPTSAT